jgi:hypothetical protein
MRLSLAVAAAALIAAACQSTTPSDAMASREIAARQGAEVDRICFVDDITGWRPLGRRSILVKKGLDEWHRLELSGTCSPQWAYDTIATSSRAGSSCLSPGDQVKTFDLTHGSQCWIRSIHAWNGGPLAGAAAPTD